MKKLYFIIVALAAMTLAACKNDDDFGKNLELSVDTTTLTVTSDGGVLKFSITSNSDWKITSSASWLSFEPSSGHGDAVITVTVSANETYKDLTESLSVNGYTKRVTVTVNQGAAEKPVEPVDERILEIKTAEDFAKFGSSMEQYKVEETVTLAADITVTAPIDSLTCNFDGKDHTINLTYDAKEDASANLGVFRKVSGAVKNLKTQGAISAAQETGGTYHVGGVAGYATAAASFENCTNGIALSLGNSANTHHAGGIVGYIEPGVNITNCRNTAKVVAKYEGACKASQLGGIVGHVENSANGTGINVIESCVNDGEITYDGGGTTRMGGICGYVNYLTELTFKNCTNNGAVNNVATGYSKTSWAYVGGITGYYGTPQEGGHVLFDGCVNNGSVVCDAAGTKLRGRVAGINSHCGSSNQNPDANGNGVNTWEFKKCTNNGDVSFKNGVSATRAQVGGILAYGEPSGRAIFDGCTSNGKLTMESPQSAGKFNAVGGLLGGNAATNSTFTNNVITENVVLQASSPNAHVGLFAGTNNPYRTVVTGKVDAATIIKGDARTVVSSSNYSTLLFALDLGEGSSTEGVTFTN